MKIFVDTAPFIYLIEENPEYVYQVQDFFRTTSANNDILITSVITLSEFGVGPEKMGLPDVISKFENFLTKLDIQILDIDKEIAVKSYQLRAKYTFLKGMDALQIATAIVNGCQEFLTNDKKLVSIEGIKIKTLTNL